jgi:hypothetical protein
MVVRTARVLPAIVATLILCAGVRPSQCEAWSLLHPFSSDGTPAAKPQPKKPAPKPSTLDKVVAAPGNVLTKVGNTITGKKPEPPKATSQMYATSRLPDIQPPKKESKSWVPSFLKPEEPKKPKTVSDWLSKNRLDP